MPLSDQPVAVIHYQPPDLLERCLADLLPAVPRARVLVVDTGDHKPLPDGWQHPGVELLRVKNHSFAHAVNRALEQCRTRHLEHLTADASVRRTPSCALPTGLEAVDHRAM